jgi:hypothetical protein
MSPILSFLEPMVIAKFLGPLDFILDGNPHDVGICDFQTTHDGLLAESTIPELIIMRNYL